jgi:hypothetical protein
MLTNHYSFYILKLLQAGLLSPLGMLSVALLLAAFTSRFVIKQKSVVRTSLFWALLIVSLGLQGTAFYTAVYEFDERPETLSFETLPKGEPNCGTAWTDWLKAGYGISNPCPKGCYRGLVARKQLGVSGFPPWPNYRREMQCWYRDPPVQASPVTLGNSAQVAGAGS